MCRLTAEILFLTTSIPISWQTSCTFTWSCSWKWPNSQRASAKPQHTSLWMPLILDCDVNSKKYLPKLDFPGAVLRSAYKSQNEAGPLPSVTTQVQSFLQKLLQHPQTNKGYLPCLTLGSLISVPSDNQAKDECGSFCRSRESKIVAIRSTNDSQSTKLYHKELEQKMDWLQLCFPSSSISDSGNEFCPDLLLPHAPAHL